MNDPSPTSTSDVPRTTPAVSGVKSRAALLSIISNTSLILLKLIAALLTGSVSILSEALHSGLDLAAALMAFFSVRAADQPADEVHPFGHGKFESVSGAAEGILILLAAFLIMREGILRIISQHFEIDSPLLGVAVMAISVLANLFISARLMRIAKETHSIALEADALHLRTDVYTSLGVMLGLGIVTIGRLFNWHILTHIDPVLAILVAFIILRAGWNITIESYHHLIDRTLPPNEQQQLIALLEEHYKQFVGYHRLRTRLAGNQRHIDFHLLVPPTMTIQKAHDLCDHLERDIRTLFPLSHVLIHIEPAKERTKDDR